VNRKSHPALVANKKFVSIPQIEVKKSGFYIKTASVMRLID